MKKIILSLASLGLLAAAASATDNINACKSCHGQHFEKHALGKSKIVKDMSEKEIVTALKGYKDGTYGGSMKGIMKGQVARISDIEGTAKSVYVLNHKELKRKTEPLTMRDKKCQKKCSKKLEDIKTCVINANNQKSMYKCRVELIKLAKKIQKKFNVKY